ncbi:hypothetical protein FE257_001838 [Aspergillus nanangensis]|uniref:Uncharacterized protein n=1 Tax=Aspergillus nanangensis TaxID=2582783 RepID=A0AAD4GPE0_ASPNN|nr:hypothetical protein FE257_001838 [Aspergillus nanangensis]
MFFIHILLLALTASAVPIPQSEPPKPIDPADWGLDIDDVIIYGSNLGGPSLAQNLSDPADSSECQDAAHSGSVPTQSGSVPTQSRTPGRGISQDLASPDPRNKQAIPA